MSNQFERVRYGYFEHPGLEPRLHALESNITSELLQVARESLNGLFELVHQLMPFLTRLFVLDRFEELKQAEHVHFGDQGYQPDCMNGTKKVVESLLVVLARYVGASLRNEAEKLARKMTGSYDRN